MSGRLTQRLRDINCGPSEKTPINVEPALMISSFYELTYVVINDSTNEESMPSQGISKSLASILSFIFKLYLEFENNCLCFSQHKYDPS